MKTIKDTIYCIKKIKSESESYWLVRPVTKEAEPIDKKLWDWFTTFCPTEIIDLR